MSSSVVSLVYGGSALLAVALLYFFHARHWYWHLLAIAAAIGIGLIPIPIQYASPVTDMSVGAVVIFLLFWGLLAPLFRVSGHGRHHETHA
ncbi:MAG TPA: hypothetical protein DEH78_02865 [Solibacterales bacterium]|nr:hypothetical protein [Bryobacterales bacterium]